jgi:hypothetical protein
MRSVFDHEELRVYQAAIEFVAKSKQSVVTGRLHLAEIVRMLVAWERSLEEK